MAEGWMLRELVGEAYVCPRTSWRVRMRLCEAMGKHLDDFRSGSGVSVEVDGTMPHESSEGNAKTSQFVLPRKPHGSGKELRCAWSALAQSCDARG